MPAPPFFAYKAVNEKLRGYSDFQFAIGETYTHAGPIGPCVSGFHFCLTISECEWYFPHPGTRYLRVEVLGDTKFRGNKGVTNRIRIVSELQHESKYSYEEDRGIVCRVYRNRDGVLHRLESEGPAIETLMGYKVYYTNGVFIRAENADGEVDCNFYHNF